MVQVVLPNDANPLGFILGGTVMHLIDIAGAIACHRHTRSLLVTAAVDDLQFLHPIKVGDLIILKSRVTCTFTTSLEVQVDVFSEETLTGQAALTSHAFLTFVAVAPTASACRCRRCSWKPTRSGACAERGARRAAARKRLAAEARARPELSQPVSSAARSAFSRSTLRSRSIPTRYLLRNLCPTIPPS